MSNSTFYSLGIGFVSGIFLRSFFDIGIFEILLVFLVSFATTLIWWLRGKLKKSSLLIASLFFLTFGFGMIRLDVAERAPSTLLDFLDNTVVLSGVIVREPDYRTNTVHLYVRLDGSRELILVSTNRFLLLQYGDRVSVRGVLKEPSRFETDLNRSFNYPGYLKARGVRHTMSFADVEVIGRGEGNRIVTYLYLGKRKFMESFERAVPEPMAGLGEGVLLGVKRALGKDLEEAFRITGIIHIVVLSGYNVMIVVEGVMRLLAFWFFPRTRMFIGVAVIIGFAVLVGLSATVVRASIMAGLLLIARATGRIYVTIRGLVLAGTAMLIHNPYLLAFDPGFVLSFLATLGLILVAPLISERLSRVPEAFNIREFITATFATQLFVLPFLLYSMGTFSLVSVVVNVLVLPMVPVAMLLTFVTGLLGMVAPLLGTISGFTAYLSLGYIITIAELFAKLPFAAFSVPAFPFWLVLLCYIGMSVGLHYFYVRRGKSTDDTGTQNGVVNNYSGWVIEEAQKEAQNTPGTKRKTFPFR